MSAWKPGDVALVNDCTKPDAPWKPATCKESAQPGQCETVWVLHESGAKVWGSVSEARPLVVIDPEDREQVERLVDTFRGLSGWASSIRRESSNAMQAALRSLLAPPRIDEPGTWGVVEASCDHSDERCKWIKHDDGNWWPAEKYSHVERQIAAGRAPRLPDDWDSLVDPALVREGVAE